MCLKMQLKTYQPPIANASQASAWSQRYDGRWMCKTEGSPTGLRKNFGRLNGWKNPLAKVVDFVPLGALSGPGAPDPDLAHFQFNLDSGRTVHWWTGWDIGIEIVNISMVFKAYLNLRRIWNSQNHYFYEVTQALRLRVHKKEWQILNISLDVMHILKLTRTWNSPNPYFYNVTRT